MIYNHNALTVPFEKSIPVSFATSIMTNIDLLLWVSSSRSQEKLICCTDFGSASSFCCLHKCIAVSL